MSERDDASSREPREVPERGSEEDHRPGRRLRPGQRCRIRIWDRESRQVRTVHESAERLYEAPNWTSDGRLLVNADGLLWFLPADGSSEPQALEAPGLPPVNNDHVLAPDGTAIYASANDAHVWAVPLEGGDPGRASTDGENLRAGVSRRITADDGGLHFLHGVSPDGSTLAYVHVLPGDGIRWASATIRTIGVDGTEDRSVTTDPGPADGCEYTPDGEWILLNTEQFSERPGHAQLARIRPDGTGLEQLTDDERVNWFPHISPDGEVVVYLSFAPGTEGHPENREVELRLVRVGEWDRPVTLVELHGGQGTINVPSWAPDGSAFAFVDYPVEAGH